MQITNQLKKIRTGEYLKILILRTIGNFLILSSLFMVGKTFYQPVREEARYFMDKATKKRYVVADIKPASQITPALTPAPTIVPGSLKKEFEGKIETLIPEDPNFNIVIPEIGANSKIKPDVDAANEEEYLDALKLGVAHARGTAFPGEGGHIFLFAHSTDYIWNVGAYNAVFYLLYKLKQGDEIDLFYKGQRYVYKVIDTKVVDPSEVEYLTRKTNKEFLTLQTCWPPGTTLKRMMVFATRLVD